ncbi:MAG: acetyl-CoA acetyltransferase [Actinomycetia bacterium]|nr:acetyl-CoA acetyltransferase [Actinomycetes bacterium]
MTAASLRGSAAVVGVGHTDFTTDSGRSEWQLAIEAVDAALADAGLSAADVDGVIRYSADQVNEAMVGEAFGFDLRYHSQVGFGGQSAAAVVGHAAAAVATGLASVVVCYRSLNGRSGARYGRAERHIATDADERVVATGRMAPQGAFAGPYGLLAPGQVMALWADRYAHEAGIGLGELTDALGAIAVGQRRFANANPHAIMRDKPLDIDAYRASRWISQPLRLYDFCLETDGAAAVVVAGPDVVQRGGPPAAWVLGCQQALHEESMELYTELGNGPDHRRRADQLFAAAGVDRGDVRVASLYDASTIMVLLSLEGYGFVEPGQAWRHVRDHGIGLDAPLAVNTSGGHLSEGYVHGFNHLIEAVRQLRGTSCNQVDGAGVTLVGAAGASGLLLGRDR